jgi:hypothetical protein
LAAGNFLENFLSVFAREIELQAHVKWEQKISLDFHKMRGTMTPSEHALLLTLAKKALTDFFKGEPLNCPPLEKLPEAVRRPAAVFVTLRWQEDLRGCIGTVEARLPMAREVMKTTLASALEDPRFPPLSEEELLGLTIEISVLSPFRRVQSPKEIVPERHGVILRQGMHRGLFLPQVWKETGWDTAQFLSELSETKAGLPRKAWQDPRTELQVFEVEAFEAPFAAIAPYHPSD